MNKPPLLLTTRRAGQLLLGAGELPRPFGLLNPCTTDAEFWPSRSVRFPGEGSAQRQLRPIPHPTKLHGAVHALFTVMRNKQRHGGAAVAEAALTLHRANFGLVVYKYPRPGVIHVFNKRFGSAPIALWEEPLPVEALQRAVNQFI